MAFRTSEARRLFSAAMLPAAGDPAADAAGAAGGAGDCGEAASGATTRASNARAYLMEPPSTVMWVVHTGEGLHRTTRHALFQAELARTQGLDAVAGLRRLLELERLGRGPHLLL